MTCSEDILSIFNALPVPCLVLLPDAPAYTIAGCNDHLRKIVNIPDNTFIGKSIFEAFPRAPNASECVTKELIRASLATLLTTKQAQKLSGIKYSVPDSFTGEFTDRDWLCEFSPVHDGNGGIKFILQLSTDITEKLQLENKEKVSSRKLLESRAHYSSLFDNNPDGVYSFDLDGRFNSINESLALMTGYSEETFLQSSIGFLMIPEDRDRVLRHFLKAATGTPQEYIARVGTAWGKHLTLQITNVPIILHGNITGVYGIAKNISELIKTEQALLLSNERYKFVTRATNAAIWDWDITSNKIYWGDGYSYIFGYDINHDNTEDQNWAGRLHPEDLAFVSETISGIIMSPDQNQWTSEYRYRKASGEYATVVDKGFLIRDCRGKAVRMVGAMTDITGAKEAELERTRLLQDLMLQNKHMEQFNYIISHNLRAPVANLMGLVELVKDEQLSAPEINELFDILGESVNNIDSMIRDLNAILAIKKDLHSVSEEVYFAEVVENIKINLRTVIEKSGSIIRYNFREARSIRSIRSFLNSIFFNLISNSIKYHKPGIVPLINISSSIDGDNLVLWFSDNGLGFEPKMMSQLYGLYKRFHFHVEGKGMGLYMVKTQVESIGGSIELESIKGDGSTFIIKLPLRGNILL